MILITGATGFVGQALTAALTRVERPFHAYKGRINNPTALRSQLEGVSTVIHLAGAERRGRPRALRHVDIDGTARLIEECQRLGNPHIIYLSRLNANPLSAFPLPAAKGQVERLLIASGLPFTIVRSAALFGPHDRFLNRLNRQIRWSWPIVWLPGGGRAPLQPLWVHDMARCLVATVDRPDLVGQTLQLAGQERLTYRAIIEMILRTTRRPRFLLSSRIILTRTRVNLVHSWRLHPPITRFDVDRFTAPELAPLDAILRTFNFQPHRVIDAIAWLRR